MPTCGSARNRGIITLGSTQDLADGQASGALNTEVLT